MKRKSSAISENAIVRKSTIVISMNQLLTFVLSRQGLIRRSSTVHSNLFPLHATSASTPCLSLSARVDNFQRDHMARFLTKSRYTPLAYTLLRCMRSTLHVVPSELYETVTRCYNYEGCSLAIDRVRKFNMPESDYKHLSKHVLDVLTSHGPMSTPSLTQHFRNMASGKKKSTKTVAVTSHTTSGRWSMTQSNVGIVVQALYSECKLFYGLHGAGNGAPSDGSDTPAAAPWRSSTRLYGIASLDIGEGALPLTPTPPTSPPAAADHCALMTWYFDMYSPATLKDYVWWAGKTVTESRRALSELLDTGVLVEIEVEKMPYPMYALATHIPALRQASDSMPVAVRFLPYEDAIIKAYKETRFRFFHRASDLSLPPCSSSGTNLECDSAVENLVMVRGEAMPTVWVDGQIVGKWQWSADTKKTSPGGIVITTLIELSPAIKARLKDELEIVGELLGLDVTKSVEYQCSDNL